MNYFVFNSLNLCSISVKNEVKRDSGTGIKDLGRAEAGLEGRKEGGYLNKTCLSTRSKRRFK